MQQSQAKFQIRIGLIWEVDFWFQLKQDLNSFEILFDNIGVYKNNLKCFIEKHQYYQTVCEIREKIVALNNSSPYLLCSLVLLLLLSFAFVGFQTLQSVQNERSDVFSGEF